METPQQILTRLGLSTTSYIRAALTLGEWDTKPIEFYQTEIANLLGIGAVYLFLPPRIAHLYFGYFVQETVRVMKTGGIPDMERIWELAQHKAAVFIKEYPYSTAEYKQESSSSEQDSWKVQAEKTFLDLKSKNTDRKTIIEELMTQTELSQPTVQTFFKEMRNKHGFEEVKAAKTNISDVDNAYQENTHLTRDEIVVVLAEKFSLTPATALMHFYRCKKLYGGCKETVKPVAENETSKDKVFKLLEKIKTKKALLKRDEVCSKISVENDISVSSVKTYYYQFLKSKNIELPKG